MRIRSASMRLARRRAAPLQAGLLVLCSALLLVACASSTPPSASPSEASGAGVEPHAALARTDGGLPQCVNPLGTVRLEDGLPGLARQLRPTASGASTDRQAPPRRGPTAAAKGKQAGSTDASAALAVLRQMVERSNCLIPVDQQPPTLAGNESHQGNTATKGALQASSPPHGHEASADFVLRTTDLTLQIAYWRPMILMAQIRAGELPRSLRHGTETRSARARLELSDAHEGTQLAAAIGKGSTTKVRQESDWLRPPVSIHTQNGRILFAPDTGDDAVMQAMSSAFGELMPAMLAARAQRAQSDTARAATAQGRHGNWVNSRHR